MWHCLEASSFSTVVCSGHLFKGLFCSNNDKGMIYTHDPTPSLHVAGAVEHLAHIKTKTGVTASLQKDTSPEETGFSKLYGPSEKRDSH